MAGTAIKPIAMVAAPLIPTIAAMMAHIPTVPIPNAPLIRPDHFETVSKGRLQYRLPVEYNP